MQKPKLQYSYPVFLSIGVHVVLKFADAYIVPKPYNSLSCGTRIVLPSVRDGTRAGSVGGQNSQQRWRTDLLLPAWKCSPLRKSGYRGWTGKILVELNWSTVQFTRSSTANGLVPAEENRFLTSPDSLVFESRFESGNLAKAVKIAGNFYELYLRTDLYTSRHVQWFYFSLKNMQPNTTYRYNRPLSRPYPRC